MGPTENTRMPTAGDIVPVNELTTDNGRLSLPSHDGKKVVMFFFPRANTSGCTKQSIQFSDLINDFKTAGAEVVGISKDTSRKQAKFRAKHNLKCHLVSDYDTDICDQFGVWVEKSMYGRTYMGIQRTTFVIDAGGRIAAVWPKVRVDGHAAEVLAFVKSF